MRVFTAAFENENTEETGEVRSDDEIIASSANSNDAIVSELDNISEGESTLITTTDIADSVEKTVESGDGMDEVSSEIVASAMEHFYDRNGFVGKHSLKSSLENYADKQSSLEATKLALEEIKDFNAKLANGLSIAQEGIFARIGNSIKLMFSSEEKIHEKLLDIINSLDNKEFKTTVIKEPGWGRSFAIIGKRELNSNDVISYLERYKSLVSSSKLFDIINEYCTIVNSLSTELSKSRFIAKDEAIDAINSLTDKVNALEPEVNKIIGDHDVKTASNDPSFIPLDIKSSKKIGKDAIDIISNDKLNRAIEQISSAISHANITIWNESNTRIMGILAKDIKAAQNLCNRLNPVMNEILIVIHERSRICYACLNYLKASIVK